MKLFMPTCIVFIATLFAACTVKDDSSEKFVGIWKCIERGCGDQKISIIRVEQNYLLSVSGQSYIARYDEPNDRLVVSSEGKDIFITYNPTTRDIMFDNKDLVRVVPVNLLKDNRFTERPWYETSEVRPYRNKCLDDDYLTFHTGGAVYSYQGENRCSSLPAVTSSATWHIAELDDDLLIMEDDTFKILKANNKILTIQQMTSGELRKTPKTYTSSNPYK